MNIQFPLSYRWLRANGIVRLIPWHFLDVGQGDNASAQFAKEYPEGGSLCTFARHQGCDDFAAFKVVNGQATDEVIYYHPSFQQAGHNPYIVSGTYPDLWIFLREVIIPDTSDWCRDEEGIRDLEVRPSASQEHL